MVKDDHWAVRQNQSQMKTFEGKQIREREELLIEICGRDWQTIMENGRNIHNQIPEQSRTPARPQKPKMKKQKKQEGGIQQEQT